MTVGACVRRVDGPAKVTGQARYAADVLVSSLAHAVLAQSTAASGRIARIDVRAARAAPGVLDVITHMDAPRLPPWPRTVPFGQDFVPMQGDEIFYSGQHIAVVVAESLEQASYAATLIEVDYEAAPVLSTLEHVRDAAFVAPPDPIFGSSVEVRGEVAEALSAAEVTIDVTYNLPLMHHNAMEPWATIAEWSGDRLTVHDSTQAISHTQNALAAMLGLPASNVRVICSVIGGGFGSKGHVWPHTVLAAVAARRVGRPVKLVLTRAQTFTSHGHRPEFEQRLRLGADRDGRLTAIVHSDTSLSPVYEQQRNTAMEAVLALYDCPNVSAELRIATANVSSSTPMRGPLGPSVFFLECAMDELAEALDLDPLELRLRNYAERDPRDGSPWNGKFLRDCYAIAADRFGWVRRPKQPRSMSDETAFTGWGMSTAFHSYRAYPASATVRILPDGTALVTAGSQDVGTGTTTALAQVAAATLGISHSNVRFEVGDSMYPMAPASVSSGTVASMCDPIYEAARAARDEVTRLVLQDPKSPLYGAQVTDVIVSDGDFQLRDNPGKRDSYRDIVTRNRVPILHTGRGAAGIGFAFGAVFAEVRVDRELGEVRVTRLVGCYDSGRILNPALARSQAIGGAIWGLGLALMEHTTRDRNSARIMSNSLSTALIPVHADIPNIDTVFIDDPAGGDRALGVRGAGEVTVSTASAIVNAIYHATGIRVRSLPATPDKLLDQGLRTLSDQERTT